MTLSTVALIDHIAVSSSENIPESGILRVALSDHYAVYCIRKFMGSIKKQRNTIISRKMKNSNSIKFSSDISQINRDHLVALSEIVNTAVEKFIYLLSIVNEKHAPLLTMTVPDKVTS